MAKKTRREDANQTAFRTLQEATGEAPKTVLPKPSKAAERGKLGGASRAKSLPAEKKSEIARKAAKARWGESNG